MAKAADIEPADRQLIEELICEHAYLIDHGQAADLPLLYTEDALMVGIGPDKRGAAIAEWAKQRGAMKDRRSRHVQTNIRLKRISDDVVAGTLIVTVYRHDGGGDASPTPLIVGAYDDLYQKCADARWRFKQRTFEVVFGAH